MEAQAPRPINDCAKKAVTSPPLAPHFSFRLLGRLRRVLGNDQLVLFILAVVIGITAGLGVVAFRTLLGAIQWVSFGVFHEAAMGMVADLPWWRLLLVPTLGGLLIGIFIRYALPGGRPQGYRAHFERMGFAEDLARIDELRRNDAPESEVVDAFPQALLRQVGYFGTAGGAAAAFKRLSQGLDTALVRVVAARPGVDSTRATIEACQPAKIDAA